MKRLLLTGAGGGLGTALRPRLSPIAEIIRISDREELTPERNEESVVCDLADEAAVDGLVDGCDGIVHFGGISVEKSWTPILESNIKGVYHLYEAARRHGSPRIVFASSNHVIGYYRQDETLDADAPMRPDTLYGVSKCFGEAMAMMYHDKFGIETARVRIGSCTEKPMNRRMLSTWMSYDDFAAMIDCVFRIPRLGCPVIYGASANERSWWDNRKAQYIGWVPKDTSEVFREEVEAAEPQLDPNDPAALYQGGVFTAEGIHEDQ